MKYWNLLAYFANNLAFWLTDYYRQLYPPTHSKFVLKQTSHRPNYWTLKSPDQCRDFPQISVNSAPFCEDFLAVQQSETLQLRYARDMGRHQWITEKYAE